MPFYIRKSIRVGPLRFNLSKSGVGVSGGIRGLRLGAGPRGNYIHMGRHGLYYRKTLHSQSAHSDPSHRAPSDIPASTPSATHARMEEITSSCITRMVDSSSVALLAELEEKRRRVRLWPLVMVSCVASLVALLVTEVTPWITIPVVLSLAVATFLAYQRDILKKSVVMMYDLDDESAAAYRKLHDAATSLARSGATWHVNARGDVYNPKYHAGAGQLVNRKRIHIAEHDPPFVRTNLPITRLPLGNKSLYFFPDRILVYAPNGVGALSYDDLQFEVDSTRFIEEEHVPRDAKVVDHTWEYVNKRGGPDRRFKNNRELPVCVYEETKLHSNAGLNELLQVSRIGPGAALKKACEDMASLIAAAAEANPHDVRHAELESGIEVEQKPAESADPTQTATSEEVYETLFTVLCCVMVADGRASRSEKARITEVMQKAGASWTSETIDGRIVEFIRQIRETGYNSMLSDMLARVLLFKRIGRQDVLLKCIASVAGADGRLAPQEETLCDRIREIVR